MVRKRLVSPTQRKTLLYVGGGAVAVGGLWLLTRSKSKVPVPAGQQVSRVLKRYGLVGGVDHVLAAVKKWDVQKAQMADVREAWARTVVLSTTTQDLLSRAADDVEESLNAWWLVLGIGPAGDLIKRGLADSFRTAARNLEFFGRETTAYLEANPTGVERHAAAILILMGQVRNALSAVETYQKSLFVRLLRLVNAVGAALTSVLEAVLEVLKSTATAVTAAADLIAWMPWLVVGGGALVLGIGAWRGRGDRWRADRALPAAAQD